MISWAVCACCWRHNSILTSQYHHQRVSYRSSSQRKLGLCHRIPNKIFKCRMIFRHQAPDPAGLNVSFILFEPLKGQQAHANLRLCFEFYLNLSSMLHASMLLHLVSTPREDETVFLWGLVFNSKSCRKLYFDALNWLGLKWCGHVRRKVIMIFKGKY